MKRTIPKSQPKDRFVVLPDLHAPHTRPDSFEVILDILREHRPTLVIQVGDWLEASAITEHPSEDVHDHVDEFRVAAEQSRRIRDVVGDVVLVRHEGNHEDRQRNLNRRVRKVYEWQRDPVLGPEWSHWRTVPYVNGPEGIHRVGPLVTAHGFKTNDRIEAFHLWKLAGQLPGDLIVRGHTHRPFAPERLRVTQSLPLNVWHCNVGTCGPLKPDFVRRADTSEWGGAVLVGILEAEHRWTAQLMEI